jgi:hypothetical protein
MRVTGKILEGKGLGPRQRKAPSHARASFFTSVNRIAGWCGSDCIFTACVLLKLRGEALDMEDCWCFWGVSGRFCAVIDGVFSR